MVPPSSHGIPRVPRYSGYSLLLHPFVYVTLTLFCWASHLIRLGFHNALCCPYPEHISTFGLASSAFARHYSRNLGWFLFLALLRCFSSGGSPHIPMYSVYDVRTWLLTDCSIRIPADRCLLTTPRSFSQLVASFFGSWCQGIPLALFVAWPYMISIGSLFCFICYLAFRFWNCSNYQLYLLLSFVRYLQTFLAISAIFIQFSRCIL